MEREWALVWPKTAAIAANSGKTDPATELESCCFGIKEDSPRRFEDAAKRGTAQATAIVIAEDRHNRERNRAEKISRELDFWNATPVGDITRDDKHVGAFAQLEELIGQTRWDFAADMEIANRRDAYWRQFAFQFQLSLHF